MMTMISCDRHPARRHLADPPAGRPAARHLAADDHVRVNYTGVGPLEMEELITRPLEQQLSAVVGPRADELDLEGRQQQHPAELRLGHRPQRGDGRHPHAHRPRARPPARGRRPAGRSSEVRPERGADHGPRRRKHDYDRVHAARAGRERAVAAARARARRRRGHRQRRPAPADPRRAVAARRSPRSTCRSIASSTSCAPRTRTSRSARSTRATWRCLLRSQGQFAEPRSDPRPRRPDARPACRST